MKITNEQLRALQERDAKRTAAQKPGIGFDEFLTRQIERDGQSAPVMPENTPAQMQGLANMSLSGTPQSASSASPLYSEEASNQMDGMISTFEQYAQQMAFDDKADLRKAYALLESMGGQIAGFKSRFPNAGEELPGLAVVLNELEVLTTTETFKFNRGDYL